MTIDDIDVFDGMRWLVDNGIDPDDRPTVEAELSFAEHYRRDPVLFERYVDWCIKAAHANLAAGGLYRDCYCVGAGFVPPEHGGEHD